MPKCVSCSESIPPENLVEDAETQELLCPRCGEERKVVAFPGHKRNLVLGRELDYGVSYDREVGLRAHASLGKAKISVEIAEEEIKRTLGIVK